MPAGVDLPIPGCTDQDDRISNDAAEHAGEFANVGRGTSGEVHYAKINWNAALVFDSGLSDFSGIVRGVNARTPM